MELLLAGHYRQLLQDPEGGWQPLRREALRVFKRRLSEATSHRAEAEQE